MALTTDRKWGKAADAAIARRAVANTPWPHLRSRATSDVIYDQYAAGEITRTAAKVHLLRLGYDLNDIENSLGLVDASASGELG